MRTYQQEGFSSTLLVNELDQVLQRSIPRSTAVTLWVSTTCERKGCAMDFSTMVKVQYNSSQSLVLKHMERVIKPMGMIEVEQVKYKKSKEVMRTIPLLCNRLGIEPRVFIEGLPQPLTI